MLALTLISLTAYKMIILFPFLRQLDFDIGRFDSVIRLLFQVFMVLHLGGCSTCQLISRKKERVGCHNVQIYDLIFIFMTGTSLNLYMF